MGNGFDLSQLVGDSRQRKPKAGLVGQVGEDAMSSLRGLLAGKGSPPSMPKAPTPPVFTVPGKVPKGAVALGNIDIAHRPSVFNPETGGYSSVWSMSIGTPDGEVLIPRIGDDGKILTEQQAIEQYKKTGRHLGIFSSIEAANAYAEVLHQQQAAQGLPRLPELKSKAK